MRILDIMYIKNKLSCRCESRSSRRSNPLRGLSKISWEIAPLTTLQARVVWNSAPSSQNDTKTNP